MMWLRAASGVGQHRQLSQLAYGWGSCLSNELGLGGVLDRVRTPRQLWWEEEDEAGFSGVRFSAVGCGNGFSLLAVEGGGLFSCGQGGLGQTGQADWDEDVSLQQGVVRAGAGQAIQRLEIDGISCGANHALLRTRADGQLWSMGAGVDGQLGNLLSGSTLSQRVATFRASAEPVLGGAAVSSFCAGWLHSLAVSAADGGVYSWGRSHYCQLGHGNDLHARKPKRIEALREHDVTLVAAGSFHSLAVVDGRRELLAWGLNQGGTLLGLLPRVIDDEREQARFLEALPRVLTKPAALHFGEQYLDDGETIAGVAATSTHNALWTSAGRLFCWGANNSGQLGVGDCRPRARPTLVASLPAAVVSAACGNEHTLALTADGRVFAWGMGTDGQLGYADASVSNHSPQPVPLPRSAVAMAAGHRHSVAIVEGDAKS